MFKSVTSNRNYQTQTSFDKRIFCKLNRIKICISKQKTQKLCHFVEQLQQIHGLNYANRYKIPHSPELNYQDSRTHRSIASVNEIKCYTENNHR